MGVAVVFKAIMPVLAVGLFRRQFFQPDLIVMVEAAFIVVNKDTGGDIHGVDQAQPLFDTAFPQGHGAVGALAEGRFSELTLPDEVLYAFSRTGGGRKLTAIFNFTPNVRRAESGIAVCSVLNGQKFEVISPETGLLELKPYGFILFE